MRGDADRLVADLAGAHGHRRATDGCAAAGKRADAEGHFGGVTMNDVDILDWHPQLIGGDLGKGRLMALPMG